MGLSGAASKLPREGGGSASVGESQTSYCTKKCAIWRATRWRDGNARRGAARERHAQKSRGPADLFAVGARRRWRGVRIAEIRSGRDVQKRGAVANRARHRVLDDEAAEKVPVVGAERVAPTRGLEAEEPAARSWDADRSPAVIRVSHGDHARGHGGGRPAARAARRPPEIPGVARRTEESGLGRRGNPQLGRGRLADDDESGPPQAPRQLAVRLGRVATVDEGRAPGISPPRTPPGGPS